ncbi:hypothetical protein [Bifidobacterium aerophilum]|nr:hypothetical protein [Bifidobacterium aerophilum]
MALDEFARRLDAYLRWQCERRIKHHLNGMSPAEWRRLLAPAA